MEGERGGEVVRLVVGREEKEEGVTDASCTRCIGRRPGTEGGGGNCVCFVA